MDTVASSPDSMAYLLEGVVGIAIGAIIGLLVMMTTKKPTLILLDAILGAVGFVGGAVATARFPYKLNTVSRRVGDAIISTTVRHYQHPYRAALLAAVLLPLIYELCRLKIFPFFRKAKL
ncbi:MAG: hypothetical protein LAO79_03665 [Acidobacteriia bacterium]|nr:hypothetical protein [Terriglobia bacterium]